MKKTVLITSAFFACAALAQAQQQLPKLDGALSRMVHTSIAAQSASSHSPAAAVQPTVIVRCTDADTVARWLEERGYESRVILPTLLTTTVPAALLPTLADCDEVSNITLPTQYRPAMTEARAISGVDDIHRGEGLETPFRGRGVVLGVIDQGFEFRHPAFLDGEGNSRVRAVWDRSEDLDTQPVTEIPASGDKGGFGHASHVTNIAAGSETGNHLYGVAPEAEIIMVPSPFLDYEVLEDVSWIKSIAESEGKPWVVNMSFGMTVGPHDGTGGCCSEISDLVGPGGLIAAAMGNEGEHTLHLSAEIKPDEPKYILCKGGEDGYLLVDFWADEPDGEQHFRLTPFTYVNYKMNEQNADFWQSVLADDVFTGNIFEVNVKNHKQHSQYILDVAQLAQNLKTSYSAAKSIVGFKIELAEGETQPRSFHAWTAEGHGGFSTVSISGQKGNMLTPDNQYQVAEGSACIPRAVAVAAYNSNVLYTAYPSGGMYDLTRFIGPEGAISKFSNQGPWLGSSTPKPLVCAPGSVIKSAVSKLADGFDAHDGTMVDMITDAAGNEFYYSAMQGTSMASPFVAGAMCLWLEANPTLDYDDIVDIVRQTSVVDDTFADEYGQDAQGTRETWSPRAGYGRIDVYAGLKMALAKASVVGIERVSNSEEPFTLRKDADSWRILFNNAERAADFRIYTVDGRLVGHTNLGLVRQGDEHVLSLAGLAPGTYIVNLTAGRCNMTRRVLVK